MVVLSDNLKEVQAPGRRTVNDIINDVNEKGLCEGQINELMDTLEFLVDRLAFTDAARFEK